MLKKEQIQQLINFLELKDLFPEERRIEDYRAYFKDEESLLKWSNYPLDEKGLKEALINKFFLENLLEEMEATGAIEFYERNGTEYKVRTSRYDIHMKILHFGDVAQYTINRKTNKKGNYSKAMFRYAIRNSLEKFCDKL